MSLTPSKMITQRTPLCPRMSRLYRLVPDGPTLLVVTALPPIPAFRTATFVMPPDCSRRARSSGQRSLPFVVDPRPSVIESPRIAIAFADAMVSTPDTTYQWSAVSAEDMLAALTLLLPDCRYEVVREPGWPVTLLGVLPKATVTARLLSGASVKLSASDQTACPWAMVTDAPPENVRARSVEVSIVLLTGLAVQTAT